MCWAIAIVTIWYELLTALNSKWVTSQEELHFRAGIADYTAWWNVGGSDVMARIEQTDSSDKRHKNAMAGQAVTVGVQSHLLNAYPVGRAPSLLAWSMSGFLSGFYRRVDRLLAKVEMVQWAEGTRWHGSTGGEGTISFYSLEIKLASSPVSVFLLGHRWQDHSSAGCWRSSARLQQAGR